MIHKWFHKIVRRRTRPIPEDRAFIWKQRLSIAYGLIAWNCFGFVCYSVYKGKADWAHYYGLKTDEEKEISPGLAWSRTLNIPNAKVIRISGLTKVDEYEIVDGEQVKKEQKELGDTELLKE